MKLPTYQFVAQMSAALAVVVSLGFVAYELKLSRDIAVAEVYQARVAMDQALRMYSSDPNALREAFRKERRGEEPSKDDVMASVMQTDLHMTSPENVFFQYQIGLLDEDEWSVWKHNMEWMLNIPCYREYFEEQRGGFRKDFAAEIDKLLAELPETDCPSVYFD